MAAPPLIGWRLRPAFRRVFPGLLAPERGEVEKRPGAAERLRSASGREIGAEDLVAPAEEYAETEGFATVGGDAEIDVEIAAGRGEPGHRPAHAFPVGENPGTGSPRHENERNVPRLQVGEMADLVGEE